MAFKMYDTVTIKDIRGETDCPEDMKPYSGQTAHIMKVITAQMYSSNPNGNEMKVYYELDVDAGKSLWPDRFLKPFIDKNVDDEYIEQILWLISDIEAKLDTIKRTLWRKKHG